MIEGLKTRYGLWKARRSIRRIQRAYAKDIARARAEKRGDAIDEIKSLERFETELHYEEIEGLLSRELAREAYRLRVPIHWKAWETGSQTGERYLTEKGYSDLRSAIRKEKIERANARLLWLPSVISLITAVAGLIGIATGLLAVWQR